MTAITLNKLVQWKGNVRKTAADQGIEELAASITAHGLLNPLTVTPDKKDKFAVVAGQRRLMALQALAKAGKLEKDVPVECNLLAEDVDPAEASLAENVVRTAMHPADQFEAWRDLADKGLSPADIAARFGVAESTVLKRLKLGRVSPKIMALYREGEIGLQHIEAFTVTDDHAEQDRVWEALESWNKNPSGIREALTQDEIPATDRRVRIVGLDAYEAAGGPVRRDLFDGRNTGYVQDAALLEKMVAEKMESVADEVRQEGWKWVEVRPVFDQYGTAYHKEFDTKERGQVAKLTSDERAEIDALNEEARSIDDIEETGGDLTDEQKARFGAIETRLEEIKNRPEVFGKAILKRAGAVITIGYDGLSIVRGLVKKPDAPHAVGKAGAPTVPDKPQFSQSLRDSLTKEVTGAMQAELLVNPGMALIALLHGMLTDYGAPVHVSVSRQSVTKGSRAEAALSEAVEAAQVPDRHDAQALWDWLSGLPQDRLLELLAVQVAGSVSAGDRHSGILSTAQALDLRHWFTPDAENYFGRVSKDQMLADLTEMGLSEAELKPFASMKKGELAKSAAKVAAELDWLPLFMRQSKTVDDTPVNEDDDMDEDDDMEDAA